MSSPVTVTRIQNRRGTQSQFNGVSGIYPPSYDGIDGFNSIPGFNSTNYPNVLQPGELAFCTDTYRVFIGNVNGTFTEIQTSVGDGIQLNPAVFTLPPAAIFTPVTKTLPGPVIVPLTYDTTSFFTLLYSITDSASTNWNSVGPSFSRNGKLEITAVENFVPVAPTPPFPAITPVTLTDSGTEINLVQPNSVSFMAQYTDNTATAIEILYMHDFVSDLSFSTSSIRWLPF